jgi:hypothetical protein
MPAQRFGKIAPSGPFGRLMFGQLTGAPTGASTWLLEAYRARRSQLQASSWAPMTRGIFSQKRFD